MPQKLLKLIIITLLLLSLAIGTIGCSSQGSPSPAGAPNPATLDKVTLNLQWLPEDPAYWVALEKGFWKEQNLDVNIIRGYGSGDTVTKIATKKADFGIADVGSLILARAKEDVQVKAVVNFKESYPGIVIYNDSLGIKTPKDLEGKSIIGSASSSIVLFFPAFAKATGINPNKVKWELIDPTLQYSAFAQGQADTLTTMYKYIPRVEKLTGKPAKFFSYKDDGGLNRYGESIIVHEDTIKENPELVRRFVAGFLKGLQYSLEHPSEVGVIMKKYVPETDPDLSVKMWEAELKYQVITGEEAQAKGLGSMSDQRMAQTIKYVIEAYELQKEISPKTIYTTEFLPKDPLYPPKK